MNHDRDPVTRPSRTPWLWALVLVTACLYISGVSASGIAERAAPSGYADCAAAACLESEEAYAAYLEPTEPELPWSEIRSVRFENGEVVVRLNDAADSPLWAALDSRRVD
jgi:hypothetical protein